MDSSRRSFFEAVSRSVDENGCRGRSIVSVVKSEAERLELSDGDALAEIWKVASRRGQSLPDFLHQNVDLFSAFSSNVSSQTLLLDRVRKSLKDDLQLFVKTFYLFYQNGVFTDASISRRHNIDDDEGAPKADSDAALEKVDQQLRRVAEWIKNNDPGKPSLRVLLCDDLPLHDVMKRTNVAKLLRRTAIGGDDVGDSSTKRFRFSTESKEQRVESLTKTFLSDASKFVARVENVIVEALQSNDLENVDDSYLIDSVATSKPLFQLLVKIFVRYVTESNFDDRVVKIFRSMVHRAHESSHHPVNLYPPHLSKLVGLIHLNGKDEKTDQLIRAEMLEVILSDPVRAKVMMLIFPGAFNFDFDTLLSSKFSSGLFVMECIR